MPWFASQDFILRLEILPPWSRRSVLSHQEVGHIRPLQRQQQWRLFEAQNNESCGSSIFYHCLARDHGRAAGTGSWYNDRLFW